MRCRSGFRLSALALAGGIATSGGAAAAALLRPMTELAAPAIRLSDLFEGLGSTPDRLLGAAPAPGGRIVVEAAQLGAIARQYGVAWHATSSADRAVLQRAGRLLPRAAIQDAVRAALIAAGAGADCDIDLPGFIPPTVPIESAATAIVAGLEYDHDTGLFAAMLSVAGAGMEPVTSRIAGRADDMTTVPVAVTRLAAGTTVQPGDLRLARVRASLGRDAVFDMSAIVGKELRHAAMAGQPLRLAELTLPVLVQKGHAVQMTLEASGIVVVVQGSALEAGGLGARVHVVNTSSRAMLEAEVTAPNQVRVRPESAPVLPGGRPGAGGFGSQLAAR